MEKCAYEGCEAIADTIVSSKSDAEALKVLGLKMCEAK